MMLRMIHDAGAVYLPLIKQVDALSQRDRHFLMRHVCAWRSPHLRAVARLTAVVALAAAAWHLPSPPQCRKRLHLPYLTRLHGRLIPSTLTLYKDTCRRKAQ